MKAVSISMQDKLYDRLKAISEKDKRKMADWCRILIENEIEKREKK
jgi:predicted DNA-binding protein